MTPLIGRLLILGALAAATTAAVAAFASMKTPRGAGIAWARRGAFAFAAFMVAANLLMVRALVTTDFSVQYVTQVGSRSLPLWVQVVSLWSSLEGSILFWGMVLGLYIAGGTLTMGRRQADAPAAIGVWLACGAFFALLIAGPAQPFATVPIPPLDGPGPNPLLQNHVLMAIHPPLLYLGYVGTTIPFGLVSAALLRGALDRDVLRLVRVWLLVAWIFLTVAIVLGGWWAYEVLGWGGYWSWDPVENASFLPWLTATSALHSLVVTERKGTLKGWTATLVMATFLLTILGTFMTRSGVFNSVHSFTQSSIGPAILSFLAVALVWTVCLLAARIDRLESSRDIGSVTSREGAFLVNNLLFVLFTLTVLVGTVFPLVVEALTDRQITVGRPYFDAMGVPIGLALLFLLGVGPALPWGRTTRSELRNALLPPLAGAVLLALAGWALEVRHPKTLLTLAAAGYAAQVTLGHLWRLRHGRGRMGSYIVHAGVVLVAIAVAVSSTMQVSRELRLRRGETADIGPYTLTFIGPRLVKEVNRESVVVDIGVDRAGARVGTLQPRMNFYPTSADPIGTPAVRTTMASDLYVSVLNFGAMGQEVTIHALINPMVVWIWIATLVMGVGGIVAMRPSTKAITGTASSGAALGVRREGATGELK